jgi:hypothetical protein
MVNKTGHRMQELVELKNALAPLNDEAIKSDYY